MIPTKEFFLAGKAIFTVQVDPKFAEEKGTKQHYTYRIRYKEASERWKETWFIQLLSGPDNNASYTYLGILTKDGQVKLTAKSKYGENSWPVRIIRRIMTCIFEGSPSKITDAGWNVHHEGRCGRCGRRLTTPESIESGIGPICAERGLS